MSKYEYLTKKDLNYKPNAFEQAKFDFSPLGKVFIDGLDKSERKEGLLKRLKNVEDRNNNQLSALRDIYRPAIRGRNNGFRNGNDDDDDDFKNYKKIEAKKREYKDEDNLDPYVNEEYDDMVRRSINFEGKMYIIGKDKSIYAKEFKNDYKKIIDDFIDKKIKYEDILDKLDKVNKGIKIYEKNKSLYKNSPNIENQITSSKKFAEGLKKIIRLIMIIKFVLEKILLNQVLMLYHG